MDEDLSWNAILEAAARCTRPEIARRLLLPHTTKALEDLVDVMSPVDLVALLQFLIAWKLVLTKGLSKKRR